MEENAKKILTRLQAQCARREYCRSDIEAKAARDLSPEEAAEVVESLVKDGFVDDLRYASAFAREKASLQGWGRIKIRFMLSAKKIAPDVISEALEEIDSGSSDRKLDALVSAKDRQLKDDPDRRLKVIRYALSRGYSYDEVKASLARLGV